MPLFLAQAAANLFPRSSALPGRRGRGDQPPTPAPGVEMQLLLLPRAEEARPPAEAGEDGSGGVLAPGEGAAAHRKPSKRESMAVMGSFVENAAVSACEAGWSVVWGVWREESEGDGVKRGRRFTKQQQQWRGKKAGVVELSGVRWW